MNQFYHDIINQLSREDIVSIFEAYGFACYESEDTNSLRESLRVNFEDGTIAEELLEDFV